MTTYNPGDKVSYQGTAFKVLRAATERDIAEKPERAGAYCVYPVRRSNLFRRAFFVSPSKLAPYVPAPKVSKHAKTCQICGRPIHAATGVIAHHGYTRPGDGYQTSSCWGARHLPFEVSRDVLGDYIERAAKPDVADKAAVVQAFVDGKVSGVPGPDVYKLDEAGQKVWNHARARYERHRPNIHSDHKEWSHYLRIARANAENQHKWALDHLTMQQGRFDTWKPVEKGGSQ